MGIFKKKGKENDESAEKLTEMPAEKAAVPEATAQAETKTENQQTEEQPKSEGVPAEEPKTEEQPKPEEVPAEEPKTEEQPKSEEVSAEEPKTEEQPKSEEVPAEEPKTEEQPKSEEVPAEEPKAEAETKENTEKSEDTAPEQAVDSEGNTHEFYEAFVAGEQEDTKETIRQILFDLADIFETILVSVFVVMLAFTFIFCVATVEGDSMLPTLQSSERLLVSRLDKNVKTGDILILDSHHSVTLDEQGNLVTGDGLGKNIVKRLIATGGQTVNIDFTEGIVYVDDQPLSESYTSTLTKRDEGAFTYPITIPEGYVFVLGDNRSISKDSRHPQVGMIPEDDIVGTVKLRLSPFTVF